MIKSLFEIKATAPSKLDWANQLDKLIYIRLKKTLEDAEEWYNDDLEHHISTTTTMLKIHDDMISATN